MNKTNKNIATSLTVVAMAAVLAACGGGGGSSDSSSSSGGSTVTAPAITTQPASIAISSGNTTTLSVVATGSSLTYQWYKDSAAVSGATSSTLSVSAAGSYYVVVSNSGGSVTSSTANVTVSSSSTALQTSVADPTYTSGSYEATAFALVNSERSKCGFGLVAQNTKLDTSAGNHATYAYNRLLEGTYTLHSEDSSLSGYTGANSGARATAAGYNYLYLSENIDYVDLSSTSDYGTALVRNMMATVYHMSSMVGGNREAGVGIKTATGAPSGYQQAVMVWVSGTASTAQQQQTTSLVTYPCAGSTGIQPHMGGTESPEPFTNLGFTTGVTVGHPLYFKSPTGTTLKLTSVTLTSSSGSVTVTLMHSSDDPNGELTSNEAFAIPRASLANNTTYTVSAAVTVDGTAETVNYSFTTGSL